MARSHTGARRPPRSRVALGRLRLFESARWLADQLGVVAAAVVLTLLLRGFVVEPYRIPSESMLPTLRSGDHVFVSKWSYRAPGPAGGFRLPGMRDPARGDVAVFEVGRLGAVIAPRDARPDLPVARFVKRVVGLPGDLVAHRDGHLWVNGEPSASWPTGAIYVDAAGRRLAGWREAFGSGDHMLLRDAAAPAEDFSIRVPEGRYFMLGDHRDHSSDSRSFGTVSREDLVGPVAVVYWSWEVNGAAAADGPLQRWLGVLASTRWERLGESVE